MVTNLGCIQRQQKVPLDRGSGARDYSNSSLDRSKVSINDQGLLGTRRLLVTYRNLRAGYFRTPQLQPSLAEEMEQTMKPATSHVTPIVFVVDDDISVRE